MGYLNSDWVNKCSDETLMRMLNLSNDLNEIINVELFIRIKK